MQWTVTDQQWIDRSECAPNDRCPSSLFDTKLILLTFPAHSGWGYCRRMPFKLSAVLSIAVAVCKDRADLVAENVALRHQLSCLIHRGPRPMTRSTGWNFTIGSMGLASGRYEQLFGRHGRTDLPKDGLAAYEEIAWTM
jgi:hypothetical protein